MLTNETNNAFLQWFVGFIEGEGHFGIRRNGKNKRWAQCCFVIKLRADDAAIIETIKRELGFGQVRHFQPSYDPRCAKQNSQVEYSCYDKSSCLKLMKIFEKYPLRTKKKRDFEIWAEACKEINRDHYGRYSPERVFGLKEKLESGRQYKEVATYVN